MMKKPYKKPEILFEDFSLSTRIASDCEVFPDDPRVNYPPWGNVFSDDRCGMKVEIGGIDGTDDHNGVCYHNVSDDTTIFTS